MNVWCLAEMVQEKSQGVRKKDERNDNDANGLG